MLCDLIIANIIETTFDPVNFFQDKSSAAVFCAESLTFIIIIIVGVFFGTAWLSLIIFTYVIRMSIFRFFSVIKRILSVWIVFGLLSFVMAAIISSIHFAGPIDIFDHF